MSEKNYTEILSEAKELLEIEAKAISQAAKKLNEGFAKALDLINEAHTNNKKIIFMGVGKSHYIAHKLAASFMSTGVTAIFVHPSEALHGDMGAIKEGDLVFMISKSGTSAELLSIIPWIEDRVKLIALCGNEASPLAKTSAVFIDASVEREACPMNLLPTASTTVTLSLGDALVSSFSKLRGFNKENFAGFHPGGSLGKRLHKKVSDVMIAPNDIASGPSTSTLKEVAIAMGEKPTGAFCVLDSDSTLMGIITDGDLRRAVARGTDKNQSAESIMNKSFTSLQEDMTIDAGLSLMESPNKKVYCAPVSSKEGKLLGLVRMHDMV